MSKLYAAVVVQPKSNRPGGLVAGSYLLSSSRTVMVRPEGDNALIRYRVKNASDVDPYPLEVAGNYLAVAAAIANTGSYVAEGFPVVVDRATGPEEMLVNFNDVVCIEIDGTGNGVLVLAPEAGRMVRYTMTEPVADFLEVIADDNADLMVRGYSYDTRLMGIPLTDDSGVETGANEANAIPLSVVIPDDGSDAAVFVPWTRSPMAAVTAYADDGSGSGAYAAVAANYDFSGAKNTLWVKVVSDDTSATKYYVVTVYTSAEDNADLLVRSAVVDSTLDGKQLVDASTVETGADEAKAIPLTVTIAADGSDAVFVPVTRNPLSVVTAYADDGTGGGKYAAVAANYDFTDGDSLWIKVTSTDKTDKFYEVTVTVSA